MSTTLLTTGHVLQYESTFHSRYNLLYPTLPVHSKSIFGRIWRLLPSPIRLIAYKVLLHISAKIWPAPIIGGFGKQRLLFNMYCKYNGRIRESEVLATMFVAANTTIPVPRILDVIDDGGQLFVLMSRVPGVPAHSIFGTFDAATYDKFEPVLRDWLYQLRSLKPTSAVVGSVIGRAMIQPRLSRNPIGPFIDIAAFHKWLLSFCAEDEGSPVYREFRNQARVRSFTKPHRLCFTHSDFGLHNMIVENGRLTGLVDFEGAGWLPEYWEYTGSMFCEYGPLWKDSMKRILPQYQDELEVEYYLWDATDPLVDPF